MTFTQIVIVAGLAAVACLLFTVTGWFALRGRLNQYALAPQNTSVPQSTATPFVIPTIAPTGTPTPIPYEMLIPVGWVQFKTGLVEIWLPAEFKSGDLKQYSDSANLAMPELLITGATSKVALYQMLVIVSYEPLTANSLDAYLDTKIANFPTDIHVAERRKVSVNSVDVIRLVIETRSNNVDVNDLVYVFLDGSTVWYVQYVAQINEFYELLSTFEQSVKTFRVAR